MIRLLRKGIYQLKTHPHAWWILLYTVFYSVSFAVLEQSGHRHYHIIHTWIDEQIPFCKYFIIPYLLWFVFMVVIVCWFIFRADRVDYYRVIAVLMMGMTLFLVISAVYPNKLDLRPTSFDSSGICGALVSWLWKTDTPTNVLPSIHVFNTVVLCYAMHSNRKVRGHRMVLAAVDVMGVMIVLSTMFLKQHSVIDVSLALVMSVVLQTVGDWMFAGSAQSAKEQKAYMRSAERL